MNLMKLKLFAWAALIALPGLSAAQTFQNLTAVSGTQNPGLYSTGAAWGDYDGDGDLDLYVTNWGTAVTVPANALYENGGDGSFVDVATDRGVDNKGNSLAPAWGDYDNDGDLDLYVGDFFDQDFLYENQDGAFAEVGRSRKTINLVRQGSVAAVAWGDYDNDGFLDLYLAKLFYDNELYHNSGDGTFLQVLDLGLGDRRDSQGVVWVDYDNDGDLDLYVANREQENALYRNDLSERGSFADIGHTTGLDDKEIGQSAAWGDYDADGDLDLYLANVGANRLYRNDQNDRCADFGEAAGVDQGGVGWITAAAAWIDYEGDGDLDLYLANGGDRQPQADILFANRGDGTFREATADASLSSGNSGHTAAVWGDYDDNGAPDLYLTNGFGPYGQGNRFFENQTPGSNFIRVRVRGLGPQQGGGSSDAIGARVRLVDGATGELRAFRQILPGDNATGLTFGAPAGPYNVEVRFPGRVAPVIISNVNGGDEVTIVEPEP